MTRNLVNSNRRKLSWRIALVYTIPSVVATVLLVFAFIFYLENTLISTAYSSSELRLHKTVEACENILNKHNIPLPDASLVAEYTPENVDITKQWWYKPDINID